MMITFSRVRRHITPQPFIFYFHHFFQSALLRQPFHYASIAIAARPPPTLIPPAMPLTSFRHRRFFTFIVAAR
jgi:hypothetical protein